MFRGLRGEEAIKFSFFLSLPAILGAVLLEGLKEITRLHPEDLPAYGIGFIASLASGLLAISLILRIVRNNGLQWFAYYCWLVGIMVVLAKLSGWL
jgi:undecaprenyl-diphosphatase